MSEPVRISFSQRRIFWICDRAGEPWARTCTRLPPWGFQLSCPLPPSPRLYTVSPLDQAEWHSVLGATQLWNHLEALKKTCWEPTPRDSDIIGVLCGLGTRTSMCSPSWYPHSPSFPLLPHLYLDNCISQGPGSHSRPISSYFLEDFLKFLFSKLLFSANRQAHWSEEEITPFISTVPEGSH